LDRLRVRLNMYLVPVKIELSVFYFRFSLASSKCDGFFCICRFYPSVTMNCRILDEDAVIGGFVIPKQVRIPVNVIA